ncbi:GAF domain-containing protein [Bacillus shivajii]|uniref:GAF domain-containing protein n=1 Tax=Bacillus shivajii TaxID=1983719 RepID=UPI001CFA248D|nr:GAF domain-containing protein [Bacillus shivajii]UCZ54072.1 GAF domain-containing protein [Bacillus shivajii]
MSFATDVASIHIMADVYKKKSLTDILQKTVTTLHEKVPYIDWAGIYFYEDESSVKLMAASNEEDDFRWEANGELKFPIKAAEDKQLGVLIVRTKEAIAFDVTDLSTLETLAQAIGETSLAN